MDSEKPNSHTTKLLTTWWDLIDHYVLAAMLTVSVASVGLQTTQDRLICIPAVNCSDFARNDSVVRRWSDFSDVADSCDQSASLVVLTKMSDRRQYDYVDNECYGKMHLFSAYYSLFCLVEAVLLLAISNLWQKYPKSASALAYCEQMLLEFTNRDILVPKDKEGQQQIQEQQQQQTEQKQTEQKFLQRLKVFEECYSHKITSKFNSSSVTGQYRFRGVLGIVVITAAFFLNVNCYAELSTGFTQCHLDGHVLFSIKHRFFQCTRSMGSYFKAGSILLFILLGLHSFFVFYSFVWSLSGERCGPVYTITSDEERTSDEDAASPLGYESAAEESLLLKYHGDAAFLFHFIHESNYSFMITVINYLHQEEEKNRRA
ncbi:PREDICTED: volume-regulated anion channel subunit LRRC8A-like isoform X2 [Acropora digitifera]|nr:PREDICTED: volume-regulated anion channel subunit LRRC8A-like isoform X2 [Acropora digitifera]